MTRRAVSKMVIPVFDDMIDSETGLISPFKADGVGGGVFPPEGLWTDR